MGLGGCVAAPLRPTHLLPSLEHAPVGSEESSSAVFSSGKQIRYLREQERALLQSCSGGVLSSSLQLIFQSV